METSGGADRIAVLIDADNTRPGYASEVLSEVAKYGTPTIRRVYGDWTDSHLTQWSRKLNGLGLRAMHQNAWTAGKNSTDLALVIDAMDLLYDGNVEAFALVTSDSDFTSLVHRLRESGKTVYVLGENKAPESLRNACDKFIDLAVVADSDGDEEDDASSEADADHATDTATPRINLQSALTRAVNAVADDEGWAALPALGNQLIRTHPSFDARNFAGPGARLSTLVADQPYLETSGPSNALLVRLKGSSGRSGRSSRKAAPAAETEKTQQDQTDGKDIKDSKDPKASGPEPAATKAEPTKKSQPAKKAAAKKKTTAKKAQPTKAQQANASEQPEVPGKPEQPEQPAAQRPQVTQTLRSARSAARKKAVRKD